MRERRREREGGRSRNFCRWARRSALVAVGIVVPLLWASPGSFAAVVASFFLSVTSVVPSEEAVAEMKTRRRSVTR